MFVFCSKARNPWSSAAVCARHALEGLNPEGLSSAREPCTFGSREPSVAWTVLPEPRDLRRQRPGLARRASRRPEPQLGSRLFARLDPRPDQNLQCLRLLLQRIDGIVADPYELERRLVHALLDRAVERALDPVLE